MNLKKMGAAELERCDQKKLQPGLERYLWGNNIQPLL